MARKTRNLTPLRRRGLQIGLALQGDLDDAMAEEERAAVQAVSDGINLATKGLKADLRRQTQQAGLGGRLGRTWRSKVYPSGGQSIDAAVLVYSKAPRIVRAFSDGKPIRARNRRLLALPTENAPRRGADGKRISPANWPEARFGPLRPVYRPGFAPILVADNLRASFSRKTRQLRGFRRATARNIERQRGVATVVMFTLVPQVLLGRRFNLRAMEGLWAKRLADLVVAGWPQN